VKRRGRPEEADLKLDFIEKIHILHDEWLMGKGEGTKFHVPAPVLVLDANQSLAKMRDEYKKHTKLIKGLCIS